MGQHDLSDLGSQVVDRVRAWAAAGAQVTGPSHVSAGEDCQDSFAAASTADGRHCFLVVADGAGSAARASTGSRLAAQTALARLLEQAARQEWDLPAAFATARQALVDEAEMAECELRDLHTTLLCAAVVDIGPDQQVIAAAIGDGAIVVGTDDGFTSVAVTPRSEYANETVFLTDPAFHDRIVEHRAVVPELTLLAVMSDGVEALAVERRGTRPVQGFFSRLNDYLTAGGDPAAVTDVLGSARAAEQSDDDKTLLLLAPTP